MLVVVVVVIISINYYYYKYPQQQISQGLKEQKRKLKSKLSGKEVRGPDRCCRRMYRAKAQR